MPKTVSLDDAILRSKNMAKFQSAPEHEYPERQGCTVKGMSNLDAE